MHIMHIKTHLIWRNLALHKMSRMTIVSWGTELVKMLIIPEILYFSVAQRGMPHNF